MSVKPSTEFALAAAARVTCCAALLTTGACTPGSSTTPEDVESGASEADQANETTPAVIAEPDPYLSDADRIAAEQAGEADPERQKLERCQAQLKTASDAGNMPPTPANKACCERLADMAFIPPGATADDAEIERQNQDQQVWYAVQAGCCELLGPGPMACTPWGPPTPPSHRAAVSEPPVWLDLRELARAQVPAGLEDQAALATQDQRAAAISTWRARMVNEHGSARVMEGLVEQLEALAVRGRLGTRELARARSFADDERRHGVLCGAVVEALGGRAEATALPAQTFPQHEDATGELEATLRNLISICCLSETVAVSLIAAERFEMPAGPLRELLTRIWADECGHAKVGWKLLPTLLGQADAATLAGLHEYLRLAFAELETHELAHLPAHLQPPIGGERFGLCDGAEARALFYATVERVIIPGLEARGLPARRAWAQRREVEQVAHASA